MSKQSRKMPLAASNSKLNSVLSCSFGKKTNKSLVDPSGGDCIQLSQSEVTFINTEQFQVYEIALLARNVGEKSVKINIKRPKSEYLNVGFEKDGKQGTVAPGLEKKIIVTFNCDVNQTIKDKMVLYCEDEFEIDVPISVHPQVNLISFDPFINLGFLRIDKTHEHKIPIQNKGNNTAEIQLLTEVKGAKVTIDPPFMSILPKKTEYCTLFISSLTEEPCDIEGSITIFPSPVTQSVIQFTGNFCEYTKFFASANEAVEISELTLKPLLGGEKTAVSFNIINNTPKSCEFRLIRKKQTESSNTDDQNSFLITPQEFGRDDEEKTLNFNPTQGELEPYSRKKITCQITAKIEENDHQMFCNYITGKIKLLPEEAKEWSYAIKAHFNDEDAAKNLIIKGTSIIPKLSLSQVFLEFPDSVIRKKSTKVIKIQNYSDRTLSVKFEKSQNYSFRESKFDLAKDQIREVQVIFMPKVIGQMNEICYLRVAEFVFPIKMRGKGILTSPKPEPKKQEEKEEKQEEMDPAQAQEINVADMNGIIPEEVSIINQKTMYLEENIKNSTVHYDISSITKKSDKSRVEAKIEKRRRTVKNRNGKQVQMDLNNLNPNESVDEYPGPGRNPQEDRIVMRQLTLNEFQNIPVGPTVIHVGQIFVKSPIRRTFHIINLNSKPISIQLETRDYLGFDRTNKNVQILPSESHGGLNIIFEAIREGVFRHHLQYIINGRHYFELQVIGTAILPTLIPSKNEFKFLAGEDDNTFEKTENFMLTNSYPYDVQYSFVQEKESLFKFSPLKGVMPALGKAEIKIVHDFLGLPEIGGKAEETVKLKVQNGVKIDLKCVSIVPECYIISKPSQLNYKEVSICKFHELKFSLRNASKNFTIFKIVPNKDIQENIEITLSNNKLSPDEIIEITVKIHCSKESCIDSFITVIARGAKRIIIPVKANIIIPVLRIEGDEIDFGSMPVCGNSNKKVVHLINESMISASMQLVLANDSFIQRCLSLLPENNQNLSISPLRDSKERKGKIYSIKIAKKCRVSLVFEFTPEQVKDYRFLLPLFLDGSNEHLPTLQKDVICRSLKNRLLADCKSMDFGKIIIEQSLDNLPKSRTFILKNPQNQEISWWVSEKSLEPFSLEENKGTLKPNEEVKIKVLFYNGIPGEFERELVFFVDKTDFEPGKPYLKMTLKASANYPEIYFDRPYVILPVVKLNTISRGNFQIINGGYENLNLKHVISQEYSHINLEVKYVNGSNLGIAKKSILVEVSFKSQKPISFTLRIDFYDHHNRVFSILVSGTADNSLFAIHDSEWEGNYEGELEKSSSFLKNYLNGLSFMEDLICDFPNSLENNDYEGLQKLLVYFSPYYERMDRTRINANKKLTSSEMIMQNYEYLTEVIKNLKSEGAFLSEIRPQFLMKESQFREVLNKTAEISRIVTYYIIPSDESFTFLRQKSWIILIYQILKVYSKVPVKKKVNQFWNIFSIREKTIISWLEQSYQSEAMLEQPKSCNELSSLGDGEMLSALVTKYTNIKVLEQYGKISLTQKEKENKCRKIIEIFQQIGITGNIRVQDILRSKPREMLIFLERLYLILPSYLQKGDPIVFSCAFGQSLTKSIEIKNPSKFPVTYMAKIQGSKAYSVENQCQFTIEPKQKHQITVKYVSNIDLNKNNGTLTLTGQSSSKFTPSTFIFVLKSHNLGRISEKSIQIVGSLYESLDFQVNVKNSLSSEACLAVEIMMAKPNRIQQKSLLVSSPIIKMKKDETQQVSFVFLPLCLEPHKYFILFRDPNVGEFQYELTAVVEQPNIISDTIRIPQTFFTNKIYAVEVGIPHKNELLVKAKKNIEQMIERINRKTVTVKKNLTGSSHRAGHKGHISQLHEEEESKNKTGTSSPNMIRSEVFNLSLTPHTEMVTLKNSTVTLEPDMEEGSISMKKINLEVNMKIPTKDAALFLSMKNASGTDIRRYRLLFNCVYKPLRYELEMRIPINQTITQPIPLINITTEENIFNATFTSPHVHAALQNIDSKRSETNRNSKITPTTPVFQFVNEKDVAIAAREQKTIDLTFNPKLQQTFNGLIKIENLTTGQLVEYEVIGIGEEPVAEKYSFKQFANQEKNYKIKIATQDPRPRRLTVVKSTFNNNKNNNNSHEIKYEKSFWYNGDGNCEFSFSFASKFPGLYEGRIHVDDENKIYAMQIIIQVQQSITSQLNIRAIERVKESISIFIDKPGKWKVEHSDPNLEIQAEYTVTNPGKINFFYQSAKTGTKQSYIILKNQQHGHLKYLLNISVNDQPQTIIEDIETELGKTHTQCILIQNPDSYPITVSGSCSNEEVFYYQPEGTITIPPKTVQEVKLMYRPTCLEKETGTIHLISSNHQKWKYQMMGKGCLQKAEQNQLSEAEINKEIIQTIMFVNPFKKPVTAFIFFQDEKGHNLAQKADHHSEGFRLVSKSNKINLDYLEEVSIPIKFLAREVKRYQGRLKILINEKIYWKYLLNVNVHVHAHTNEEPKVLKLETRNKKQISLVFDLPHIPTGMNGEKVSCSLHAENEGMQNLLDHTCRIVREKEEINEGRITYTFNFLSYKPYVCPVTFHLADRNGCRWIHKGEIDFQVPPPDDELEMITSMNKATSVIFRVNNRVKTHAKFKAYLTANSDMDLSLTPKAGELQPFGREGTPFEVVFAPTQYKNNWHGKIVIETDDSYWSYVVKGHLPHYEPPVGKSSINNSTPIGATSRALGHAQTSRTKKY